MFVQSRHFRTLTRQNARVSQPKTQHKHAASPSGGKWQTGAAINEHWTTGHVYERTPTRTRELFEMRDEVWMTSQRFRRGLYIIVNIYQRSFAC